MRHVLESAMSDAFIVIGLDNFLVSHMIKMQFLRYSGYLCDVFIKD